MSDGSVRISGGAGGAEEGGRKKHKRSLKERAFHEVKRLAAMFVYLYVLFGLFSLHEFIILAQHQIPYDRYGFAFVNAWLLAKAMLVAEDLHLGRGFEDRPLAYPILFKSIVFAIMFICVLIVEKVIVGVWGGRTIVESIPSIGGGGLIGIVAVAMIISFALIPFFAFRELARTIGKDELRALILTRRTKAGAVRSRVQPPESA
jgi:hypothetical protein